MKCELTSGWSIFKQIFDGHRDQFKHLHPRYDKVYYDDLMEKMRRCGNPEQIGYIEYRCPDCGQGKHLVATSAHLRGRSTRRCVLPWGDVPARYQTLSAYLAKSVVTPPISVRRIDRYDGHRVVLMKWTRPDR
jgi:hypothetical protein